MAGLAWLGIALCFTSVRAGSGELPTPATGKIDFATQVAPLLKRCQGCHGPQVQMNGLRLDSGEAALKGSYSGPVIVPGKSAESLLIKLVAGLEEKRRMPPMGSPLTGEEVGILRAWIDQGAAWPLTAAASLAAAPVAAKGSDAKPRSGHWSFQPIVKPPVPDVVNRDWVRNPIDAFVLAKLESLGIDPSPQAPKDIMIRRVSLDLMGLPPTPQEVAEFLSDNRPDAYEHLVDRLLASQHYGEKWARHWLDVARYADSDGYEKDYVRPYAWRYRQWVIDALNRDMPFDEFTIEQIAGDLLPATTVEQRVATAFQRNTLKNREGGVNLEQFRFEETVDRTDTVGAAWLGLTVGCAQCHDHKYDPITQKDHYRLEAYFNNIREVQIDAPMPGEMGPYLAKHKEYLEKRKALLEKYKIPQIQAAWEEKMRQVAKNPGKWTDWDIHYDTLQKMSDGGHEIIWIDPAKRTVLQQEILVNYMLTYYSQIATEERVKELKFKELQKELADLKTAYPQLSQAMVVEEVQPPRKSYLHVRGQWDRQGIELQPGTPEFLPAINFGGMPPRLELARWLVSKENPLTARVIVNRAWQELFGRGIVGTTDDFGTQGERPTHPELLDWLASEFRDQGWSQKKLHRLIVTSATYRQSSHARPDLTTRDPGNTLLARQQRLRLPAELIRDSALEASGLLDPTIGGKSARPPQPDGVTSLAYDANGIKWIESQGSQRYRRGLYIHFQRTVPYPFLINFDEPDSNLTACKRNRSNTPLQSLNLLNDPVFLEAAQALASRVLNEARADEFDSRLSYAFELCLGRKPNPREEQRLLSFYQQEKQLLEKDTKAVSSLWPAGLEKIDPVEAASWVSLSRVLLNLDEFITRE